MPDCVKCSSSSNCKKCANNKVVELLRTGCAPNCATDEIEVNGLCEKCDDYITDCKSCPTTTTCDSCKNNLLSNIATDPNKCVPSCPNKTFDNNNG